MRARDGCWLGGGALWRARDGGWLGGGALWHPINICWLGGGAVFASLHPINISADGGRSERERIVMDGRHVCRDETDT
jgi:hypothetical protein